jgi:hypothetical protein
MYLTESKTFTSVIFKLIEGIQNGKTHFEERYDYHRSMNKGVSNPNMNTGEFYFPTRVSTGNDSKLYISKVTLDKSFTKVDFISYNNRSTTYCGIGRNTYLLAGGRKYMLNKAVGISFIPEKTEYPNWKSGMDVSLAFTLYFEPLPLETTSFDFIENAVEIGSDWSGDGWRINGVKLQRSGWINVEGGSKIETSHHSWEALAVQLQYGQTVVRKCVTPKDNGTYMFSSYDEFIEDADTGRKYYLRNSSIGFKHNSLISYDRDPIDFSEVYPELPQNVKRIHISSGSQYYVRDLIIR